MSVLDELVAAQRRVAQSAFAGGVLYTLQWLGQQDDPRVTLALLDESDPAIDALIGQLRSEWNANTEPREGS